jgi:catechol 2,3-dioxygenase-like lactoylglutathione lyase family enzyme
MPKLLGVLETCLYVDDLQAAEAFYGGVLGLPVVSRQPPRHLFLRCGNSMLLLFDPAESMQGDELPPHGAHGAGHVALAMEADDFEAWLAALRAHQIEIENDFRWPHGGRSLYFRDPAGNSVELTTPSIWGIKN